VWNSEQPDQALKEKCGEEMKSDTKWDLGTEGGQQRLLIPTAGVTVTAAYAEQAQKVTLNASPDIFTRCSKLQTSNHCCFRSSPSLATCDGSRLRCKCAGPAACFHCWTDHAWAREMKSLYVSDARNISILETIFLQSRSFQRRCPTIWECIDRTNLHWQATNPFPKMMR
jgi:hypothetical protein